VRYSSSVGSQVVYVWCIEHPYLSSLLFAFLVCFNSQKASRRLNVRVGSRGYTGVDNSTTEADCGGLRMTEGASIVRNMKWLAAFILPARLLSVRLVSGFVSH
jgi:hypothetical protein